jgi:hypothetical protein
MYQFYTRTHLIWHMLRGSNSKRIYIWLVYLINHASDEAMTTERMIPSEKNSPPAEVSTQWMYNEIEM